MVQTTHIDMLKGVVVIIDLIKYLPGYIEFNPLPHDLKLIPVLFLIKIIEVKVLSHRLVDFVVEFVLCFLHFLVENLVVLCTNFTIPLELIFWGKKSDV